MTFYFVINTACNETSIQQLTEEELKARLKPDGKGMSYYGNNIRFLEDIVEENPAYWEDYELLVIRGEVIVPRAVEYKIVTEIEL